MENPQTPVKRPYDQISEEPPFHLPTTTTLPITTTGTRSRSSTSESPLLLLKQQLPQDDQNDHPSMLLPSTSTHPAPTTTTTTTTTRSYSKMEGLTLATKLIILEELDKVSSPNYTEVARRFQVNRTTISKIHKRRDELMADAYSGNLDLNSKRKRPCREKEVEDALFGWLKTEMSSGIPVNTTLLKAKAREIASDMHKDFQPNDSWINRFKTRRSLSYNKHLGYRPAPKESPPSSVDTPPYIIADAKTKTELIRRLKGGPPTASYSQGPGATMRVFPYDQDTNYPGYPDMANGPGLTQCYPHHRTVSDDEEDISGLQEVDMEESSRHSLTADNTPSHRDLLESLSVIQTFLRIHNLNPNDPFQDIEQKLLKISADDKRQSTIDSFFKPV